MNMFLNAVRVGDELVQTHVFSADLSAEPHMPTTVCLKDTSPWQGGDGSGQVRRKLRAGLFSEEETLLKFSSQAV